MLYPSFRMQIFSFLSVLLVCACTHTDMHVCTYSASLSATYLSLFNSLPCMSVDPMAWLNMHMGPGLCLFWLNLRVYVLVHVHVCRWVRCILRPLLHLTARLLLMWNAWPAKSVWSQGTARHGCHTWPPSHSHHKSKARPLIWYSPYFPLGGRAEISNHQEVAMNWQATSGFGSLVLTWCHRGGAWVWLMIGHHTWLLLVRWPCVTWALGHMSLGPLHTLKRTRTFRMTH